MEMSRAIVFTLTGRPGEALETLAQISRIARSTENDFMLNWSEIYYGLALATTGDLAAGEKVLKDAAAMFAAWGNTPKLAEAHFVLGQIFLEVATSKEKPTLAFLRRNWKFLARYMLVAKKEAKQHFEKSIEFAAASGCPGWGAYSHLCLGKLALAGRDHEFRSRAPHCGGDSVCETWLEGIGPRDRTGAKNCGLMFGFCRGFNDEGPQTPDNTKLGDRMSASGAQSRPSNVPTAEVRSWGNRDRQRGRLECRLSGNGRAVRNVRH